MSDQTNHKLDTVIRLLRHLTEAEEEREYQIDNPDRRHPSPLLLAFREAHQAIAERISVLADHTAALVISSATISKGLERQMIDVTKIQTAVDRAEAGIESCLALLTTESEQVGALGVQVKSLSDQLAVAIAANDPAAQQAVQDSLDAMATRLNTEADKIDTAKNQIAQASTEPAAPPA